MGLADRFRRQAPETASARPSEDAGPAVAAKTDKRTSQGIRDTSYQELKSRVHNRLFEYLDLSQLPRVSEEKVTREIAQLTRRILDEEQVPLTEDDRAQLVREVQHEVFGLGPLEPLLKDPAVCDILVNGPHSIFVERHGKLEKTVARFKDDAHLMKIIEKITTSVGRRVDESSPMVDARLADGSRVNVIVPPLAIDGPSMSIRRFALDPLTSDDLVESGSLTPGVITLCDAIVRCRLNVLVSGGTGSGKTTLLNILSSFVPETERVVTIEDSAELQLRQEHVVRLETRPANIEGKGRITQRELVINALRMRPDRIIVGEVRGGEALDMLQAMNTGHDGSITTIHANTARDALTRIETMVAMTGLSIPSRAVRQQIASAIDVVIQLARLADGSRRLISLQELTGMEGEVVTMQEIFTFEQTGVDEHGRIQGEIVPTGIRPRFAERLARSSVKLPADIFEAARSRR
jgi:pilus assembly protein CpaF